MERDASLYYVTFPAGRRGGGGGGGGGSGGGGRTGQRDGGRRVANGSTLAAGCPGVRHRGDGFFTAQVQPVFCRLNCANDDSS